MFPVSHIVQALEEAYGLGCPEVNPLPGGMAALAFRVSHGTEGYFCKVYDKKDPLTAFYTRHLKEYLEVSVWLEQNTALQGRLSAPLPTLRGSLYWETDLGKFVLFPFLPGENLPFGQELSQGAVQSQLAEALRCLHLAKLPDSLTAPFQEDFQLPFLGPLTGLLTNETGQLPSDCREATLAHCEELLQLCRELSGLSQSLGKTPPPFVLCHTDLHGGNLMWDGTTLRLIDWESIRFAPKEADLFLFSPHPQFPGFLEEYGGSPICDSALRFYCVRRKLEDIWEFLVRLRCPESCFGEERKEILFFLHREYEGLARLKEGPVAIGI